MLQQSCVHLDQIRDVKPSTAGCCDSSKNKHATKHFRPTGHPIVRSIERGENRSWCYVGELLME